MIEKPSNSMACKFNAGNLKAAGTLLPSGYEQ